MVTVQFIPHATAAEDGTPVLVTTTTPAILKKLQNGSDVRGVALEGVPGEPVTLNEEAASGDSDGVLSSCAIIWPSRVFRIVVSPSSSERMRVHHGVLSSAHKTRRRQAVAVAHIYII